MGAPFTGLEADAWIGAVSYGIKPDIDLLIKHERWMGAAMLIYAAIDAMAYTTLPTGRDDVQRGDFIAWAERYVKFGTKYEPTGADLYGARCAVLHSYGNESKLSRTGQCRVVGHTSVMVPPVKCHPNHPDKVAISVPGLRDAVFAGIDEYGDEVSSDPKRWPEVEARLLKFNRLIPT